MVAALVTNIPFMLAVMSSLKGGGVSYWIHDNNPLPELMKYNTQCCNDPTIKNISWGDSS